MSTTATPQIDSEALKQRIQRFRQVQSDIVTQVRRVIVGQEEVLEQVMIGLFVGGHCLITGLPGTAKTLLVRTLAQTLGLIFKRIQFTPDLMPSDITGTDIIEEDPATGHRTWTFVQGPIFGNILLADDHAVHLRHDLRLHLAEALDALFQSLGINLRSRGG